MLVFVVNWAETKPTNTKESNGTVSEIVDRVLDKGEIFRMKRSGGFPKFPPIEECGSRIVQWSPDRKGRVVGGKIPPRGEIFCLIFNYLLKFKIHLKLKILYFL